MTIAPLAIVQARMGSVRLPGKLMLPFNGHPLIYHAYRRSVEAFGEANVVVAMPASEENDVLAAYCERIKARVFRWSGPESDVLGRFYACSNFFRWHPETIIVRVCGEDPFKQAELMKRVVFFGERHPVELSCEAITLQNLNILHNGINDLDAREHLSLVFSPVPPPSAPEDGCWTIDTTEDYEACKAQLEPTGGVLLPGKGLAA